MSKLGFGFMRLPLLSPDDNTDIDFETVKKMVDIFLERGFNYFDTAYRYHEGMSEVAIKKCLTDRYAREEYFLASKMTVSLLNSEDEQEKIFNEQLEKCGVDYFDNYLVHNLTTINYEKAKKFNTFAFVKKKKEQGKIKHLGFSFHDNAALLDKILSEHPEVEFVQLQINYMDWENESIQSRKCFETAKKHGKEVIVMEPIKGGSLAKIPKKAEDIFKTANPKMSVASWAIRYAASLDVKYVLSGMSSIEHVEDNTGYMQNFKPLNEDEYKIIDEAKSIIDDAIAIPCTSCEYCVEICPQKIAIPNYFALYNNQLQFEPRDFSIQREYYHNYTKNHGKASDCIECGDCLEHCPQMIDIPGKLKSVVELFEKQSS